MKRPRPTGWDRPLARPVVYRGGTLKTLGDAVYVLLALPLDRQAMPPWTYLGELLQRAHASGKAADIADATAQIGRALSFEGWL